MLDGWWHFEDGQRRLPSAPVLSRAQWQRALFEEGFSQVATAPESGSGSVGKYQSFLLAESDGNFIVENSDSVAPRTTGSLTKTTPLAERTAEPGLDPEEYQPAVEPLNNSAALAANAADDQIHLQALVEERVSAVLRKLLRLEVFEGNRREVTASGKLQKSD